MSQACTSNAVLRVLGAEPIADAQKGRGCLFLGDFASQEKRDDRHTDLTSNDAIEE